MGCPIVDPPDVSNPHRLALTGGGEQLGKRERLRTGSHLAAHPHQPESVSGDRRCGRSVGSGREADRAASRNAGERVPDGYPWIYPHSFGHTAPIHRIGGVAVRAQGENPAGAQIRILVPDRECFEIAPYQEHPASGTRAQEIGTQLENERGHRGRIGARAHATLGRPARVLQKHDRALQLSQPAKYGSGIDREADRLIECRCREIQIEKAIGIAPVALEVPVSCIEKVEAAELKPGPPIIGSSGQIAAEQSDRQSALTGALEGSRPRSHVGVDSRLGTYLSREKCRSDRERSRTSG